MTGPAREAAQTAAAPDLGITERPGATAPRSARPARWARGLWAAGYIAAAIGLFAVYLRLSNTAPEDSDQANLGLQAWDMLHGNLLLHGWWVTSMSPSRPTELPQYVLLEFALRAADRRRHAPRRRR